MKIEKLINKKKFQSFNEYSKQNESEYIKINFKGNEYLYIYKYPSVYISRLYSYERNIKLNKNNSKVINYYTQKKIELFNELEMLKEDYRDKKISKLIDKDINESYNNDYKTDNNEYKSDNNEYKNETSEEEDDNYSDDSVIKYSSNNTSKQNNSDDDDDNDDDAVIKYNSNTSKQNNSDRQNNIIDTTNNNDTTTTSTDTTSDTSDYELNENNFTVYEQTIDNDKNNLLNDLYEYEKDSQLYNELLLKRQNMYKKQDKLLNHLKKTSSLYKDDHDGDDEHLEYEDIQDDNSLMVVNNKVYKVVNNSNLNMSNNDDDDKPDEQQQHKQEDNVTDSDTEKDYTIMRNMLIENNSYNQLIVNSPELMDIIVKSGFYKS